MIEPHSSNFRVITTNFLGVRMFRKFTVSVVIVLGVLQSSLSEVIVQTVATLVIDGEKTHNYKAPADKLTVVLNYNLL